jgi:GntR family transcriptional regulator, transcriptional repressor for pyruvate dehydrogenase complex
MAEPDPVSSLARMDRRREPISSEVAQILVRHLLGGDYQPGQWGLLLGDHQLEEVIEARTELEVMLAALAAERRTDQDVHELEALLRAMREAADAGAFVSADVAFHLRIAKSARNSIFEQMLVGIQSLQRSWITRVIASVPSREPSYSDHVPIHAAIRDGDAVAAREAMRDHLNHAAERLKKAIASRAGEVSGAGRD